jgi:hypothetical protein
MAGNRYTGAACRRDVTRGPGWSGLANVGHALAQTHTHTHIYLARMREHTHAYTQIYDIHADTYPIQNIYPVIHKQIYKN